MNEPAHILLIGNEPANLQEQTVILRHFWTIASSPTDGFDALLPSTDAVVLCHSLADGERQEIIDQVNREHPKPLLVKINGYDSGPHAGMDASVDLHHGPAALVSVLYELLKERSLPSRGWPGQEFELAPGIH